MQGKIFKYNGYEIPVDLVNLTGGGTDTWDAISIGHMEEYELYCPISPNDTVLEVGCGVGRDAIQLTKHLGPKGKYIGFDIIKPSIEWCQKSISTKYPNFKFYYYDLWSQIHNPNGKLRVNGIKFPAKDKSVDRIVLHSVFTHMFREDIVHYLKEFRRVLKPDGKAMASFFVLDQESLELAKNSDSNLKFEHKYGKGCYINDLQYPEGAIGYTPKNIHRMLRESGLKLDQPIHRGFWSGRRNVKDGQDILVLRLGSISPLARVIARYL